MIGRVYRRPRFTQAAWLMANVVAVQATLFVAYAVEGTR